MSSLFAPTNPTPPVMTLRPYQQDAVSAVYDYLRSNTGNPCMVLPTGAGKAVILASICRDAVQKWNGRVLILAHVKELLEQATEKLLATAPDLPVGVYSAGLRRRDLGREVTVAGIQSIFRRACDLGPVDLIIVDEAHLIPADDSSGMYRQFLSEAKVVNPHVRIIGMTATPFRMKTGMICGDGDSHILDEVCYEIGVKDLIDQGYLSPLRTRAGQTRADMTGVHMRAGDFVAGELESAMDTDALVEAACAELVEQTRDRSSVLIFTSGVRHGEHVAHVLRGVHGVKCGFIEGGTPAPERSRLLEQFRAGELKFLANVNVLTTGFDAPNVDCVAMLRPTMSPGLYSQMVGRGCRLHPGKTDCLILDFGGNVLRHGPVDQLKIDPPAGAGDGEAPAKECPQCHAIVAAGCAKCPECGHVFPPPEREKHEAVATGAAILSGQVSRWDERVSEVAYYVHRKGGDMEATPTLRVEYRCSLSEWYREWVCLEHPRGSYAWRKAAQWWSARSNEPVPDTVQEAVDLAEAGALAITTSISVEHTSGQRWERVVGYELGDKPPRLESNDDLPAPTVADYGLSDHDLPF